MGETRKHILARNGKGKRTLGGVGGYGSSLQEYFTIYSVIDSDAT